MGNVDEALMALAYKKFWAAVETIRYRRAQKMWYWYVNDKDEILAHILTAMRKVFDEDTLAQITVRIYNVVERIINRLGLAYKEPAVRTLNGGQTTDDQDKVVPNPQDERYQAVLTSSSIERREKEWNKLGKYFNTVLVQPQWRIDETTGKGWMDFVIHTPAWTVVNSRDENWNEVESFYYSAERVIDGKSQEALVWWDRTSHYYIDRIGARHPIGTNSKMINPYGVLPVAILRFKQATHFWGEGWWDLVDQNEEICVQFTNLMFNSIFQTHGIPVGVNLGLKGKIKVSASSPILVDETSGGEGKAPPDLKFATAEPMIQEVRDMIDWMVKLMQNLKGLTPQSYELEQKLASGVSKMADSAELVEMRQDDEKTLAAFETDLFNVTRVVYNFHNPGKKIDDKAVFSIKFGEQTVAESVDDRIKRRTAGIENNWMSILDIIMEDNPGMSKEDAEKKLEQIILENRRRKDTTGISDLLPVVEPVKKEADLELDVKNKP